MNSNLVFRWMRRGDLPQVMAIDDQAFGEHAWTEDVFIDTMRRGNCIGVVVEDYSTREVVGYLMYEWQKKRLHLFTLAVRQDMRRQGIGRMLLGRLTPKLASKGLLRLMAEVRETNLDAQLFFAACGFRATSVLKNFYDPSECRDDAYVFEYRYPEMSKKGAKSQ